MPYRMLLDTSSLTYRAFFALPTSITGVDGRPVNAVRGVLDMHASLLRDHGPDEVVHVFDDDWRPAPRVAAYPGYKSQRPEDPDGLPEQFDVLVAVLDALGLPRADAPGWEADDAIATLCAGVAPDDRVDVVTGDRDLLQVVRDDAGVRVLYTVKGVKGLAIFDETAVEAKHGVPARRYADYAALRGDPSDGLPGVPGVGEKTARALVAASADLDDLLARADEHPPRVAQRLREAGEYLAAMREVVPVRTDVEVRAHRGARDDALVDRLAERHKLESPVRRLREALGG